MIVFPCSECGQKLNVDDWFAGRDCRCPQCQHVSRAPALQAALAGGETVTQPPVAMPVAAAPWPTLPDYELLELLGKGGMGQVFKARHLRLDRLVALKVIRPDKLDGNNPQVVRRFLHEIRVAARLDHPHLIKVFDAGSAGNVHFLSMELIDGIDLARLVKQEGPLSIDRAIRYLKQAAEGLAYAHTQGLVHRDIKPHNMLLDRKTDQVKILDLGLARMNTGEGLSQTPLTETGAVMGTLDYMAPEQGLDSKGVDGRADLYSLGCTAYHLLTGRPPFQGGTTTAILLAHQMHTPEPITSRRPEVPAALAAVVARLLAKKAEDRFATAAAVVQALDQASGGRQPPERNAGAIGGTPLDGLTTPARPIERRQKKKTPVALWLLATAAALILFLGILGYALLSGRPDRPEPSGGQAIIPFDQPTAKASPAGFQPLPGQNYFTNAINMVFVKVPKGKSWMGGGGGKGGIVPVTIAEDFYLGVFEVTQEQWQAVMANNPSFFARTGAGNDEVKGIPESDLARFPVEQVSWDDCQEFIKRLNEKEKDGKWVYRLPTEAEWEYACRGGAISKEDGAFDYYLDRPTNTLRPEDANFRDSKIGRPAKVGSYQPNRLGLYDMHGNVAEWCQDLLLPQFPLRVVRGGGMDQPAGICRASVRSSNEPPVRDKKQGLRMARVPNDTPPKPPIQPLEPRALQKLPGKDYHTNTIGMHFVKVPKGSFWMGGGGGKPGTAQVAMPQDFYLSVFEVTQEQWQVVMGVNPSHFSRPWGGNDKVKDIADAELAQFPVEKVSWEDCQEFIKRLNEHEKGKGWMYRLPREAEWEFACRGGASTREDCSFYFYLGRPTNTLPPDQANYLDSKVGRTVKVGSYQQNRLGIYDLHGNVFEWCQDLFDPKEPNRVVRGGCWNHPVLDCYAGRRNSTPPSGRFSNLGLRLARVPSGEPPAPPIESPEPRALKKLPDKDYHTNTIGMHFVKVPKGTSWLGGGDVRPGKDEVTFKDDFYLGVFEVTQEQWQAVMGQNPSFFSRMGEGKDNVQDIADTDLAQFPVENVSWDDCQEFAKRLNEHEKGIAGWVYRLPLDTEWEYGCRGGPATKEDRSFNFYLDRPTDSLLPKQANFRVSNILRTVKVGSYLANQAGLYDMHGNVRELCQDRAGPQGMNRVDRGGSWDQPAGACRADKRGESAPSLRTHGIGLRLARVPTTP